MGSVSAQKATYVVELGGLQLEGYNLHSVLLTTVSKVSAFIPNLIKGHNVSKNFFEVTDPKFQYLINMSGIKNILLLKKNILNSTPAIKTTTSNIPVLFHKY